MIRTYALRVVLAGEASGALALWLRGDLPWGLALVLAVPLALALWCTWPEAAHWSTLRVARPWPDPADRERWYQLNRFSGRTAPWVQSKPAPPRTPYDPLPPRPPEHAYTGQRRWPDPLAVRIPPHFVVPESSGSSYCICGREFGDDRKCPGSAL